MRKPAWSVAAAILSVLVTGSLTGCAELRTLFSPRPAPTPPAARIPAPAPPSTRPPAAAPAPPQAPPPTPAPPSPAPTSPPTPAAPREEAPPATAPIAPREKGQPSVLSPKVGAEDTERLKQESTSRIQQTEDIIKPIDQARLNKNQQDTYTTIQSFLTDARQALSTQDYLRASNLADKAHVLAEELSRGLK